MYLNADHFVPTAKEQIDSKHLIKYADGKFNVQSLH